MLYYLIRWSLRILSRLFFPLKVIGLENIPTQGPCILASNHRSYLDPVLLGYTSPRRLSYVAKEELFANRWFKFLITSLGAYPIKRHQADFKALRETFRRLKAGKVVLIFPEGTRMAQNPDLESEQGIGFIVAKTKVPVVPVFLEGTDRALAPGEKEFRLVPVQMTFGPPVKLAPQDPPEKVTQRIMEAIYALAPR